MAENLGWTLWVYVVATGVAGATLNALRIPGVRLWPRLIVSDEPLRRLLRPGLVCNWFVGGGASAAMAIALTLASSARLDVASPGLAALVGIAIGFVAARCVTGELDNRLLRVAVCKAAASPAAHPDTVRALGIAPPDDIYRMVDALMPRRAMHP